MLRVYRALTKWKHIRMNAETSVNTLSQKIRKRSKHPPKKIGSDPSRRKGRSTALIRA